MIKGSSNICGGDHINAFQGIEVPTFVQKQAGLIRKTKKGKKFVNLEFLFVAPKKKKHFRKAENKVFYYV